MAIKVRSIKTPLSFRLFGLARAMLFHIAGIYHAKEDYFHPATVDHLEYVRPLGMLCRTAKRRIRARLQLRAGVQLCLPEAVRVWS